MSVIHPLANFNTKSVLIILNTPGSARLETYSEGYPVENSEETIDLQELLADCDDLGIKLLLSGEKLIVVALNLPCVTDYLKLSKPTNRKYWRH